VDTAVGFDDVDAAAGPGHGGLGGPGVADGIEDLDAVGLLAFKTWRRNVLP
jgi:hypothetical protein